MPLVGAFINFSLLLFNLKTRERERERAYIIENPQNQFPKL